MIRRVVFAAALVAGVVIVGAQTLPPQPVGPSMTAPVLPLPFASPLDGSGVARGVTQVCIPNGTNLEQACLRWNGNAAEVAVVTNGGTARNLRILGSNGAGTGILLNANASDTWFINQSGGDWATGAGNIVDATSTPTISSGFGTSPSIAGKAWAFRVTEGNPVGTSGVVAFNRTFTNAPACSCTDETTATALCSANATTTQVTLSQAAGTIAAADKLAVLCRGF